MAITPITRTATCAVCVFALFTVTACGDNQGQRALSGGAIGAGVGAVGTAIVGANPVAGALIGGAAGAATGALTSKKQIDLGEIK